MLLYKCPCRYLCSCARIIKRFVRLIVLSGGTGTPKLLMGLIRVMPEDELTVIVNTAEDLWISGNLVCPDIDTVLYTLAGMIDVRKWWGVQDDSFTTYQHLQGMGHLEKLMLGDIDRAAHIMRSELIRSGKTLTEAILEMARSMHIRARVLPMCDEPLATIIHTPEGEMHFQDFWIAHGGEPEVTGIRFRGIENAMPSREVMDALSSEDAVLIGPSNPITSIGPILGLPGFKDVLKNKHVAAVSPIIGKAPVSGPAGKLMKAMGYEVSSRGVLDCYGSVLDALFVDGTDDTDLGDAGGIKIMHTNTIMNGVEDSIGLAQSVLNYARSQ